MSNQIIRAKVLEKPTIRGKMDVRFPAKVEVQDFLKLVRENGIFKFGVDYNKLADAGVVDPDTAKIAFFDQSSGSYKTISIADISSASIPSDLQAIADLTGSGGLHRVSNDVWALRTITAGDGIEITNGNGVSGNPTIALDADSSAAIALALTAVQPGSPSAVPAGGTTGQVLAKASGTDGDTEWVDQSGGGGPFEEIDLAFDGFIDWAAVDSDHGPFRASAGLDSADENPHLYIGYNTTPGANLVNTGDRGLILGIESDYAEPGIAPHHAMEWYIQYQFGSGFGSPPTYTRMLMGQIDKTTNLPTVHYQSAAGIGFKWGWLDGTGTDEQKVVGKTKMSLTDDTLSVFTAPGGSAPILTLDSVAANSATGINVTSAPSGSGVHMYAISPNSNEAFFINARGVGGLVVGQDDGRGVIAEDGSASIPSYSFIGDQDTGWYLKAAGNFTGSIGGVDVVDVTSSGQKVTGKAWGTQGVGVPSGSGGTVTQATSKSTTVTLSKASGEITMNNAALAADTQVMFTFGNSLIEPTDVLALNYRGGTNAAYVINAQCANGGANMYVRNVSTASLSEGIVIRFVLIKGATT